MVENTALHATDFVCVISKKAQSKYYKSSDFLKNSTESISNSGVSLFNKKTPSSTLTSNTESEALPLGWIEAYDVKLGKIYIDTVTGCSRSCRPKDSQLCRKKDTGLDQRLTSEKVDNNSWKLLPKSSILKTPVQNNASVASTSLSTESVLLPADALPTVFCATIKDKMDLAQQRLLAVPYKMTKNHLLNIKVVGQVSNKFIACLSRISPDDPGSIVLFDQHAVHERIRLEHMVEDIFDHNSQTRQIKTKKLTDPILFKFNGEQVGLLTSCKKAFAAAGLQYNIHLRNHIYITEVPAILCEQENLKRAIQELIEERIKTLTEHGSPGISLPPMLFNLLCSKACHGAIKFGDALSVKTCSGLMKDLAECNLPFQCAHGRPSLCPLVHLDDVTKGYDVSPCNFARLKQQMTAITSS